MGFAGLQGMPPCIADAAFSVLHPFFGSAARLLVLAQSTSLHAQHA